MYKTLEDWCIENDKMYLLGEWHSTKNINITPKTIASTTKRTVWWKCSQGHEWESSVGHRTSGGNGCPYCSNHRILAGYNDLQTRMPALALEWNYEKNGDLKPTEIGVNNTSLVWWKCRYGHEWKASTHNRYRSGCGCPKCSAHGTSLPEQGIAFYLEKVCKVEQRTIVAGKEIDIYLPEYKIGIEYDGKRYHTADTTDKEKKKDSKVFLAGVRLIRIKEAEGNRVDDNVIYFDTDYLGENYNWAVLKLCEILACLTGENKFNAVQVNAQTDLPSIYEKLHRYFDERSLSTIRPDLAKEWHPTKNANLLPEMFSAGSIIKVWWQCSEGHEWQAVIRDRVAGNGCPFCSGKRLLVGFNDLATIKPELAKEWHPTKNNPLTPMDVTAGSSKRVWWKCLCCGLEWQTSVANRSGKGTGCPKCSFEKGIRLRNKDRVPNGEALADKYPMIASEWHPEKNGDLTPADVVCGSGKLIWWLCSAGHEYQKRVKDRVGRKGDGKGLGCPYCRSKSL